VCADGLRADETAMNVHIESTWDCPPSRVWDEVQTSRLLLEVASPLVRLSPVDAAEFPVRWSAGTTLRCRSRLFGVIPLGVRTLHFERIDHAAREIQTRECDPLIRRWDHLIRVADAGAGCTRYSDSIEIDAGWLTLPVWLFAQWFYRHRHRRWRAVAARLAAAGPAGDFAT
jgi:hypothetical protein